MILVKKKGLTMISWLLFVVTVVSLILTACIGLHKLFVDGIPADVITEWLINYQGGFVRRGLTGEVLLQICSLWNIPIVWLVVGVYFIGVLILTGILIKVSRKIPGLLYLLPYPIFLYVFAGFRLLIARRDAWLLILTFFVFGLLQKYLKEHKPTQLIGVNVLLCVGLLIHEASVFYIFSLVFVTSFVRSYKTNNDFIRSTTKMFIFWCPVFVILLLVSVFHGDVYSAKLMATSWKPFLEGVALNGISAFDFMEMKFADGIREASYSWLSVSRGVPVALLNLYVIVGTYYLVTRASVFYSDIKGEKVEEDMCAPVRIGAIMIVQGICLLPSALLFMSDLSRVLAYWTISSVMAAYWLKDSLFLPDISLKLSAVINEKMSNVKQLSLPWVYFGVLITLPVGFHHGDLAGMFPFLTLELKSLLLSMLIS